MIHCDQFEMNLIQFILVMIIIMFLYKTNSDFHSGKIKDNIH